VGALVLRAVVVHRAAVALLLGAGDRNAGLAGRRGRVAARVLLPRRWVFGNEKLWRPLRRLLLLARPVLLLLLRRRGPPRVLLLLLLPVAPGTSTVFAGIVKAQPAHGCVAGQIEMARGGARLARRAGARRHRVE
jgi:hypothetical protein